MEIFEEIYEEKEYKIKTDKNNEMDLYLRNHNNEELSFTLFNNNAKPSKKYELKCNLEELQKNRFFKIFISVEEIIRELEKKIEKSKFIEDTNCIIIEIQIGLTIINEILLVIEEQEKTNEEKINELLINKEEMIKIINNLTNENEKLKNELNEKNKKLKEEKEKKIKEESEKKIKILENELNVKDIKLKDAENKIKLNENELNNQIINDNNQNENGDSYIDEGDDDEEDNVDRY